MSGSSLFAHILHPVTNNVNYRRDVNASETRSTSDNNYSSAAPVTHKRAGLTNCSQYEHHSAGGHVISQLTDSVVALFAAGRE